jgi:hypothetical protein
MQDQLKDIFKNPVRAIFYLTIITSAILHIFK